MYWCVFRVILVYSFISSLDLLFVVSLGPIYAWTDSVSPEHVGKNDTATIISSTIIEINRDAVEHAKSQNLYLKTMREDQNNEKSELIKVGLAH
jgi:hypothetical protein